MTSTAPIPAHEEVTYCQRHPDVETALRCGRCDTLICPRCLVYTPAGTRCPDCARLRRPVMYELSVSHYLRAAAVVAGLGAVMGVVGAFLVPVGAGGFLFLTLAIFGGSALGGAVASALTRATRGKRGPAMQAAAVATLVLADVLRLSLAGGIDLVGRDLLGSLLVAMAAVVAWGRLR
jgi:hypothetical protein